MYSLVSHLSKAYVVRQQGGMSFFYIEHMVHLLTESHVLEN